MSEGKRLRIGVVGVGRRGSEHLATIAAFPDRYELVAVCDLSEAAARAKAASLGVRGYSNLKEFFGQERPDVVVVATPRDTHHLVARVAAAHGVHMLIETPLGQTRQMMDGICESVARSGVKAEVGENMWRRPSERLTRSILDAGLIGKVLRVSSTYDDAGDNLPYHTVSRMRVYADADVEEVRAYARVFKGTVPIRRQAVGEESWTHALLAFSNGVLGTITYVTDWTGPLRGGHPRFLSVEGTEGFVVTGVGSPNLVRRVEQGQPVDYPLQMEMHRVGDEEMPVRFYYETNPEVQFSNPFSDRVLPNVGYGGNWDSIARADELESIYRAVTTDGEPSYGLQRGRRDVELSIVITEAARVDRPLPGRLEDAGETVAEREAHAAFRRQWGFDPFDTTAEFMSWK